MSSRMPASKQVGALYLVCVCHAYGGGQLVLASGLRPHMQNGQSGVWIGSARLVFGFVPHAWSPRAVIVSLSRGRWYLVYACRFVCL